MPWSTQKKFILMLSYQIVDVTLVSVVVSYVLDLQVVDEIDVIPKIVVALDVVVEAVSGLLELGSVVYEFSQY